MGSLTVGSGTVVYLDSAPVIYTVERIPRYHTMLVPIWASATAGSCSLVSSELTLLEVLVVPLRERRADVVAAYEQALSFPELALSAVTPAILRAAAGLRAASPALKTPDAIHIATAHAIGATHFVTNDRRLRQLPGLQVVYLDDLL